ncbi:anhydro-N-acetylmuramic acid kinase [Methylomonas sp. MED-D]|uniref:anhydro-N-acetylmuramic acid kinase n=1 Tax=unclassified Methylomonas TaxID=2608980 RepID=UPI0028A4CB60|nr:anhydro-N-acetylmuramic acid kinase [Methylomonas sp. MV1]MDT4332456.1 anhydro-N-acetylmuramic acid kinase [Methylomonas sp. MV1]
MPDLYIGLISGTSVDGIDAALVDFSDGAIRLIAFHYHPFGEELRNAIYRISQPNQPVYLKEYGELDCRLGILFGDAATALLAKANIDASSVNAIGSHGQTIYHAPEPPFPFTLQIGDPNVIAECTGITTVADLRRRDIAAGGQGAPLVPAFHSAVFGDSTQTRVIVNIGGIANITVLNDQPVIGFDTGPGNGLMDWWCQRHRQQAYDAGGAWAAAGKVHVGLLATLLDDRYFRLPPPKSTGKEYFSSAWLTEKLQPFGDLPPQDVQATLCQFTADSIAAAIASWAAETGQVLVCGGGAHNHHLLVLLEKSLKIPVESTARFGIDPNCVEAMAFAWLAKRTLQNQAGNLTSVTGAKTPVTLGGIYPGNKR